MKPKNRKRSRKQNDTDVRKNRTDLIDNGIRPVSGGNLEEVQKGDVLIGNRLIITSALLLDHKIPLDEARLLDFCTLINAISFYDRLITIPSRLPDEVIDSSLYNYLVRDKILYDFDRYISTDTREEIQDLFGVKISDAEIMKSGSLHYTARFDPDFFYNDQNNTRDINAPRLRLIQEILKSKVHPSKWNYKTYEKIIGTSNLLPFRIRTAAYWVIPGIIPVSFLPDFFRIPLIAEYNSRLKQLMKESVRTQEVRLFIEKKSQEHFRNQIKKIWPFANPKPIPIPNATLTFLQNYSSPSEVGETLRILRREFSGTKRLIEKWESVIRDANNVGEAVKKLDEISSSMEPIKKTDLLRSFISIAMGATRDLWSYSPGINTAEAVASALPEIYENVKKSITRFKLSHVYSGIKQKYTIKNNSDLLENAFGSSLTNDQRFNFLELTEYLDKLTAVPTPE